MPYQSRFARLIINPPVLRVLKLRAVYPSLYRVLYEGPRSKRINALGRTARLYYYCAVLRSWYVLCILLNLVSTRSLPRRR